MRFIGAITALAAIACAAAVPTPQGDPTCDKAGNYKQTLLFSLRTLNILFPSQDVADLMFPKQPAQPIWQMQD